MRLLESLKDKVQGKVPGGTKRSPRWRKCRKFHLSLYPKCEVCSTTKKLEVHHIVPFYMNPNLELHSANLITLCRRCHLFIGHLGSYRCVNTACRSDVEYWKSKFDDRC